MTRDEAVAAAKQVNALNAKLAGSYPCEACDGLGTMDTYQDMPPCYQCFGKGWAIPSEEEEDE